VGSQRHAPPDLPTGNVPRDSLDWCGKSRAHRDSIPLPSSPYTTAVPASFCLCCHGFKAIRPHNNANWNTCVCRSPCKHQQSYNKSGSIFGCCDAKQTPVHLTMWLRFISARWSCERTVIFWCDGEGSNFYGYDSEGIIFISIT
jgi:hypothetical protein